MSHSPETAPERVLAGAQAITLCGQRMLLTAQRALVWPERAALLVADLHIGKAASFRQRGVPVPQGTTTETLDRLSALITACAIESLYVLGDFFHTRFALPASSEDALRRWRARHAHVHMVTIPGNHDPEPDVLQMPNTERCDGAVDLAPFILAHQPFEGAARYVLCGHVHPTVHVRSRYDAVRLPCYWLRSNYAVLPAFGAFTGGYAIRPEPTDHVFVVTQGAVHRYRT